MHQYLPVDGSIIGTRIIAVDLAHQYLPGTGSIIGAQIIAVDWVYQYLSGDGSIIDTRSTENTYNINITYSTNTNHITMATFMWNSGNIQTKKQ